MREVKLSLTVECISWVHGHREDRVTGCTREQAEERAEMFREYYGRGAAVTITEEEYS